MKMPAEDDNNVMISGSVHYESLSSLIQQAVDKVAPAGANVLVVSKGDDQLINLTTRSGWHFPGSETGAYAGYYPANDNAAIIHLEAFRAKGADFLVFPYPSFWWLEHYSGFHTHLDRWYSVVHENDACVIYDLRRRIATGRDRAIDTVRSLVLDFQAHFDNGPTMLDWDSGLQLATSLPGYNVFSPLLSDSSLPYLDESIDIVVAANRTPDSLAEALRVAAVAVIRIPENSDQSCTDVSILWKVNEQLAMLPAVSILLTWQGAASMQHYLRALCETLPAGAGSSIELIIASKQFHSGTSVDFTGLTLPFKAVRAQYLESGSSVVHSLNEAISAATGEIIVFLDNGAVPLPGWLSAWLRLFRKFEDAGAVGGKLVYPDGRLKEAGGLIASDASLCSFGQLDVVMDAPLYEYVRVVDYCSHAFLATKRELLCGQASFDERFSSVAYALADYAFNLREKGYRTYYQPESTAISGIFREGPIDLDSAFDFADGNPLYNPSDAAILQKKWKHALEQQPAPFDWQRPPGWLAVAVESERLKHGGSRIL